MKRKSKVSLTLTVSIVFVAVMLIMSFLLFMLPTEQTQKSDGVDQTSHMKPLLASEDIKKNVVQPVSSSTTSSAREVKAPKESTNGETIHFIHIPKCGGTTMTTLLREIQCVADPVKNADCCLNPGFCDWHAKRRCATIMGCINHFPNRKLIYKPMKSIAVVREPISRLLSAWFYRGHSPNNDFFQVRPEFKEIREGKRPKVTFREYLEMHEYQNIQTRMLGADSFPYRNITITEEIYQKAEDALQHLFFIGLQEEFQLSSELLLRELGMADKLPQPEIKKERDQSTGKTREQKAAIKEDEELMRRAKEVNRYDLRLYAKAVELFCATAKKYPDLADRIAAGNKVQCA